MNVNTHFNLKRFGRLLKQDLIINRNAYLLTLLILTLAIYALLYFQMMDSPNKFSLSNLNGPYQGSNGYQSFFFVALIGLGLFIGNSFTQLGNKVKRTAYLLTPASTFEKYLHPLVVRVLLGTILFFLIYWLDAHLARLSMMHTPRVLARGIQIMPFEFSMIFRSSGSIAWFPITFALISTVFYLFAAPLFFKKQALVNSLLAFFPGIFAFYLMMVLASHLFFPDQTQGFRIALDQYIVYKNIGNFEFMFDCIVSVNWLFFLLIGFFELKEMRL